jgi:hypothetical protein
MNGTKRLGELDACLVFCTDQTRDLDDLVVPVQLNIIASSAFCVWRRFSD